jgi:hypothetical protein
MKDRKFEIANEIKIIDSNIEYTENLLDQLHIERKKLINSFFVVLKNEATVIELKNRQHDSTASGLSN